jgi:ABC-type glycerol-3-phosphate transport system substrate-binding protein
MKKKISWLFKIILPIFFFTGCTEKKENDKIKFVSLAWQKESIEINKSIIKKWNELNPGKQVEYVQANWNSIYDYLITSFETGDVPDVFHYEASMITDFGNRGNLTDLKPYLSDNIKNDIYPVAWQSVTLNNGKIIGVPFLFESLIVLYNKDIFSKNNIIPPSADKPWNWADIRNAAISLTKDTDSDGEVDQWGAAIGLRSSANIIINLTLGCGGSYFYLDEDEYKFKIDKPEKFLLSSIHDMIYKYECISPLAVSQSGSGIMPAFYSGKYAMVIGIGTWARQQLVENAPANFHWGVLEPIKEVTKEQGSNTQTLSVPSRSERKKEAVEFIEFFLDKNNLAELALGDWMNPTRISCRSMPEFQSDSLGWKTCISIIDNLIMGPWLKVPGFSEWKGRVANPLFQEYFLNRVSLNDLAVRMREESNYVLSRYQKK